MKEPEDQIWAYLHDELAPDKKACFEHALENDPHLRSALEERRATHVILDATLPELGAAEENDDELEARLLAEWEEQHAEFRERPPLRQQGRIIRFGLPLAAAAAAMFLLLALPGRQGPIRWQRTSYGSAPQLRGEPASKPYYSRSELKQISQELQESIEAGLLQRTPSPDRWELMINLQELAGGALMVDISGYALDHPQHTKEWNVSGQNVESLRSALPAFTRQVAEDMAERNDP